QGADVEALLEVRADGGGQGGGKQGAQRVVGVVGPSGLLVDHLDHGAVGDRHGGAAGTDPVDPGRGVEDGVEHDRAAGDQGGVDGTEPARHVEQRVEAVEDVLAGDPQSFDAFAGDGVGLCVG